MKCAVCGRDVPLGKGIEIETGIMGEDRFDLKTYHPDCYAARFDLLETVSGQMPKETFRGKWPHVMCRLELTLEKAGSIKITRKI